MSSKTIKWVWECVKCSSVQLSSSEDKHKLDKCSCGESFVDLAEGYARTHGDIEIIKIK